MDDGPMAPVKPNEDIAGGPMDLTNDKEMDRIDEMGNAFEQLAEQNEEGMASDK